MSSPASSRAGAFQFGDTPATAVASSTRNASEQGALIAAFREGLGFAGIAVIRSPNGIRFAAVGPAGVGALAADESGEVRFWCRRGADAERVAASAKLPRQSIDPDLPEVTEIDRALVAAAARAHVRLYSHDEITAEAMAAIARMEDELASLQRAGALRSVNRSYRIYRQDASARGEKVVPYAQWFRKYKENLVRQVSAALRYF
jgi:hypothetical protein